MPVGQRGTLGRAVRTAALKVTALVDALVPDRKGRAPRLHAVVLLWSTRTVMSKHVLVSGNKPA